MKKLVWVIALCATPFINLLAQGAWTQKADIINGKRCNATSFSIGSKGYVCCGVTTVQVKDLIEYDPATDTWTQKADFPGVPRRTPISFSIGNRAYVGLGCLSGSPYTYYYDFYEYNPVTDIWTQKASFPGAGRAYAHHFTLLGKGYVGGGTNNGTNLNDLWEYNPATDTWTQKNNPGYPARNGALAFSLRNKAYVGTGQVDGPTNTNDFWEYDPATDVWTQKASLPAGVRNHALGFAITDHGYVISGYDLGAFMKDFWEYDILNNTWIQLPDVTGSSRSDATGFGLNEKVYIGTGWDGNTSTSYLNDFWEYTPANTSGIESTEVVSFSLYPNPANDHICISAHLSGTEKAAVTVYNPVGAIVYEGLMSGSREPLRINISAWAEGVYCIEFTSDNNTTKGKFIKIH